jgi:hypothetical protein
MLKEKMNNSLSGKPILSRAVFMCALALLLLAACERPASKSNWSPINDANAAATASALPETLPAAQSTEPATSTPAEETATVAVTAETIPTLDLSQLPAQLPHAMKGYDLYSWQVGEKWDFTLITGTNRTKSFDEIVAPGNTIDEDGFIKITISGLDDLESVLALLPAEEEVIWSGMDLGDQVATGTIYLTLPPQTMIDELTEYCQTISVHLTAIKP